MMTSHPCKPVVSVTSSASNSSAKFGLRTLFFLALMFLASSFVFCRAESEVPEDTRRWSNGVGLWGKRSPPSVSAADLLDGMMQRSARLVHKRPEDSWHKLNSLWGKRSAASNWQTATGLWGKRSAPPLARFEAAADYDANIWPRS